jgi:hypothetical protein
MMVQNQLSLICTLSGRTTYTAARATSDILSYFICPPIIGLISCIFHHINRASAEKTPSERLNCTLLPFADSGFETRMKTSSECDERKRKSLQHCSGIKEKITMHQHKSLAFWVPSTQAHRAKSG